MVSVFNPLITDVKLEAISSLKPVAGRTTDTVTVAAQRVLQKQDPQKENISSKRIYEVGGAKIEKGLYKGEFIISSVKMPYSMQSQQKGYSSYKELFYAFFVNKDTTKVSRAFDEMYRLDSGICKTVVCDLLAIVKEDPSLADVGLPIFAIESLAKDKEWVSPAIKQRNSVENKVDAQEQKSFSADDHLSIKIEKIAAQSGIISSTAKEGKGPFLKALEERDTMKMISALREGSFSLQDLTECFVEAIRLPFLDAICLLTMHLQKVGASLEDGQKKILANALEASPNRQIALALREHLPISEKSQEIQQTISVQDVEVIAAVALPAISFVKETETKATLDTKAIEPIAISEVAEGKKGCLTRIWSAVVSLFTTDPERMKKEVIVSPSKLSSYPSLAKDESFMLAVVKEEPATYLWMANNLLSDRDFHLKLIRANPMVAMHMTKKWLQDPEIKEAISLGLSDNALVKEKTFMNVLAHENYTKPMPALKHLALVSGIKGRETGEQINGYKMGEFDGTPRESGLFAGCMIAELLQKERADEPYAKELSAVYERAADANITSEERLACYQKGEPIILLTGHHRHSVAVVLHNEHMIICNRGDRDSRAYNAMSYNFIDPSKVTKEIINNILLCYSAQSREAMDILLYEAIPSVLASDNPSDIPKMQRKDSIEAALYSKNQSAGNCTYAAWKSSFKACQFLMALQKEEGEEGVKEAGRKAKESSDRLSLSLREEAVSQVNTFWGRVVQIVNGLFGYHEEKSVVFAAQCKVLSKKCNLATTKEDIAEIKSLEKKYVRAFLSGFKAPSLEESSEYQKYKEKLTRKENILSLDLMISEKIQRKLAL